jgi:hypothetical protein
LPVAAFSIVTSFTARAIEASFSVSLPTSVQLAAATGSATMSLGSFSTTLTGSQGSLNTSGNSSFGIGGTLTVNANQAIGTYSGNFTVTLNYN